MNGLHITRAGVLGTLVVLGVAAACVRLGIWQLDRLEQRRERNAAIAERMHAPPVELSTASDTSGLLHRTVSIRGEYDDALSIVLPGRSHRGMSGAHVLTPLRLDGSSTAVLVNRGWIPLIDPARFDPAEIAQAGVRAEGIVLPFPDLGRDAGRRDATARPDAPAYERVWYRIDRAGIESQLPYDLFDAYVQLLPADAAPAGGPTPLTPPALDDGPHLGYAIQWFSFAAIALIGWTVLAIRRGEVGRGTAGSPTGPTSSNDRYSSPPTTAPSDRPRPGSAS